VLPYGASFSGSNYLSVANYTGNPAAFSISCWAKLTVDQTSRVFFGDYQPTGSKGWVLGISDAATNKVKLYYGGGTLTAATALTAGVWAHAVGTWDGTTFKIYLNGNTTPDASVVAAASYGTVPTNNYIGSLDGTSQNLNGQLAGVGYWSKALSTAEVTSLYNGGSGLLGSELSGSLLTSLGSYHDFTGSGSLGTDSSGGGHTMTNTGTVTWTGWGPAGSVYRANTPFIPRPSYAAVAPAWRRGLARAQPLVHESGSTSGMYDVVTRAKLAFVGSPSWGRGPWGSHLVVSDSATGAINFGTPIALGATEFTLSALCSRDGSASVATNRSLWEDPPGTSNVRLVLNSGLLQFQVGSDGAFTNLTTLPPEPNQSVLVTIRLAPGGVRSIWYGPYKQAERTDASAVYGSTAGSTGLRLGTGAGAWAGNIMAGYVWDRALPDARIVAMAADPFAPVRGRGVPLGVLAAGAGLTLSGDTGGGGLYRSAWLKQGSQAGGGVSIGGGFHGGIVA
jgi:hypothetical protein